MKVDFRRLTWENYPSTETPINADNLNRLEEGVAGLYSDVHDIEQELGGGVGEYVTDWLNEHVDPVGSAVVVDNALSIAGAAADAKKTGDEISSLKEETSDIKSALFYSYNEQDDVAFSKGTIDGTGTFSPANNGVYTTDLLSDIGIINAFTGCRFTLFLYDKNGGYIGKINSSGALDKVAGNWKFYTGLVDVNSVQKKYSATFIRICILPTDGTSISEDTAQTYGDAHSDFYKLIISTDQVEKINANLSHLSTIPELRNGSVNNFNNLNGVATRYIIPTNTASGFRIFLNEEPNEGYYYRFQYTTYSVDSGQAGYPSVSDKILQRDMNVDIPAGQGYVDFVPTDGIGVKGFAFTIYEKNASDSYNPIRIENINVNNFLNIAFIYKTANGNDFSILADMIKRPVTIIRLGGLKYNQSFCVYNEKYYSTNGSNIAEQDFGFNEITSVALALGHGNSFQRGSSNIAYVSGWDDNSVYAVNLDTLTIIETYQIPTTGYTTVAVDEINKLMYIFQRNSYPNTVENYNFITYDYEHSQVVSQKKTTNKFGAMQSCDFVDGKIFVVYGMGTTSVPTGVAIYNTSGDIIGKYDLQTFSETELEGICYDSDRQILLISDVDYNLYSIYL